VALHLALRLPQRVAGLVLTGASGLLERSFGTVPGMRPSRAWIADRVREVFFDPDCVSEQLIDDVASILHNRACLKLLVRLFLSARMDNVARLLHIIRCPALLIWGQDDIVTPPEAARQFHALLPDSELHILDRCGHAPMIEHPLCFARLLDNWWRRCIDREAEPLASVA
jgi:2-hydroxy-6-oxonona-2,4-dienedioate hydrolase